MAKPLTFRYTLGLRITAVSFTTQGRSRVSRTPWPGGIKRPSEDRELAPKAKTKSKNYSWDINSTLNQETRKAKGTPPSSAKIGFQARGLDYGGLECQHWAASDKPNDSVPRTQPGHHAVPVRDVSNGTAGHLSGMLTQDLQ